MQLRNQFDNFTIQNTSYYFSPPLSLSLSFSLSFFLILFIYSFVVIVIVTAATIAAAPCLCMLENNTKCIRTTTIKQANERESKPIFNNIKRQVHDREGKRERELLNRIKKKKYEQTLEYKIWSNIFIARGERAGWVGERMGVDSSLVKNNSHIWCTTYTFTASLTRWVALIYARRLNNNCACMYVCMSV